MKKKLRSRINKVLSRLPCYCSQVVDEEDWKFGYDTVCEYCTKLNKLVDLSQRCISGKVQPKTIAKKLLREPDVKNLEVLKFMQYLSDRTEEHQLKNKKTSKVGKKKKIKITKQQYDELFEKVFKVGGTD